MGCCASSYKRKWKHEHTGHEVSHGNYNGGYHVGDYEGNHGEKMVCITGQEIDIKYKFK